MPIVGCYGIVSYNKKVDIKKLNKLQPVHTLDEVYTGKYYYEKYENDLYLLILNVKMHVYRDHIEVDYLTYNKLSSSIYYKFPIRINVRYNYGEIRVQINDE
jgi:hypothetical protein